MRYSPTSIALVVAIVALLGCGTSPTAPEPTGPPQFDPAVLFARLAGSYTLTFEADESCPLPPALRVLTYDAVLEPTRYRYLGVRVASNPHVVGDLWVIPAIGIAAAIAAHLYKQRLRQSMANDLLVREVMELLAQFKSAPASAGPSVASG